MKTEAWIVFDTKGEAVYIDSEMTEREFRSWYGRSLDQGCTMKKCKLVPIEESK